MIIHLVHLDRRFRLLAARSEMSNQPHLKTVNFLLVRKKVTIIIFRSLLDRFKEISLTMTLEALRRLPLIFASIPAVRK